MRHQNNVSFKNRAFSLIELSIVVLIIGILIAGVTQGSRLFRQSRLSVAKSLTQNSPVHSITGLILWFETTSEQSFVAGIGDGDVISTWYDINSQAILKNDATQAVANNKPTYIANGINGLPTVSFNANASGSSGDMLSATYSSDYNSREFTIFVVVKAIKQTTDWGTIVRSRDTGNGGYTFSKGNTNNSWRLITETGGTQTNTDDNSITFDTPFIFSLVRTSTQSKIFKNGVNTATSTATYAVNDTEGFLMGGRSDLSWFFDGYISEVIYYNRFLKTSERQDVENYLSKKWAIAF